MSKSVTLNGGVYRVVKKPTHTVIYRRHGSGPFSESITWDSRRDPLKLGSVPARVLAAEAA